MSDDKPTAARTPGWRDNLVPLIAALVVAVAAIAFRGELIRWFTGDDKSSASGETAAITVGAFELDASIAPDPPRQKGNRITLAIARDGAPVTGAEVAVELSMPAMGSMPAMRTAAEMSETGGGRYAGSFDLDMGGTWTVEVSAKTASGSLAARYNLTVGARGLTPVDSSAGPAAAPAHRYSDAGRAGVVRALAAYETIRAQLAGDRPDKIEAPAKAAAEALGEAIAAETGAPPRIARALDAARAAANELAAAVDLETARAGFARLSEPMVTLAAADPVVSEGLHLYECSMTAGYNKWLQPSNKLTNPYKGTEMLTCGSELELQGAGGGGDHDHDGDGAIDHYTCPMETWVKEKKPGTCPVCGMDLVPVTVEEVKTGVLRVDHRRRQLIGLKTARVERRSLAATINAVGRITFDETRVADVTTRTGGFVRGLRVEAMGEKVRRGQVLFSLYAPELYSAQKEFLLALAQKKAASSDAGRARADALLRGARQRLSLWEISDRQLERLAASGQASEYLPITSPASGYVVDKNVVEGAAVTAGQRLFRIADLREVWVEADVYEQDIGRVKVGQSAEVRLTHLRDKTFTGKVSFIYPYLDGKSRTARVRIALDNKKLELKPAMYADVTLSSEAGERLAIPEAAVIYSGPRRIVFVDAGGDKLAPRLIKVGLKTEGYFEVLDGLSEGELVVTSGNFLLSAESRLKAATGLWNE